MSITTEIWEDSGAPVIVGSYPYGSTRVEVNNVGFKSTTHPETTPYVYYPVTRPNGTTYSSYSYTKYNFFKISGTYSSATRVRATLNGTPNTKARILYKWTNDYNAPSNTPLNGVVWTGDEIEFLPFTSTIGPQEATGFTNTLLSNTTYYTNYLVTQLYLETSTWDDIGNIGPDLQLTFTIDEYE